MFRGRSFGRNQASRTCQLRKACLPCTWWLWGATSSRRGRRDSCSCRFGAGKTQRGCREHASAQWLITTAHAPRTNDTKPTNLCTACCPQPWSTCPPGTLGRMTPLPRGHNFQQGMPGTSWSHGWGRTCQLSSASMPTPHSPMRTSQSGRGCKTQTQTRMHSYQVCKVRRGSRHRRHTCRPGT